MYVDGNAQAKTDIANSLTGSILNSAGASIASVNGNGFLFTVAALDEVRIYAKGVILSPGWITAEYNNHSNPGTFFAVTTGLTKP